MTRPPVAPFLDSKPTYSAKLEKESLVWNYASPHYSNINLQGEWAWLGVRSVIGRNQCKRGTPTHMLSYTR